MAYSIIQVNKIPEKDTIILANGYEPPLKLNYVKNSFQNVNKSFLKKLKTWNTPIAYDRYINALTEGSDFIAYIDIMAMYQRILVSNPKCKGFNFIEEGSASYVKPANLALITQGFRKMSFRSNRFKDFYRGIVYILRGYSIRLLGMPFAPVNYTFLNNVEYYCLSKEAYPGVESKKKNVIVLERKWEQLSEMAKHKSLKNAIIWIEDSFAKSYDMPEGLYREAIVETIEWLRRDRPSTKIYLKLRPNQHHEKSLVYKCLKDSSYEAEVLDNNIIMEALLARSENCTLVGNVSSLLFYAPILGHQSLSIFNKIKSKPQTIFDDLDVYWKNVNKI